MKKGGGRHSLNFEVSKSLSEGPQLLLEIEQHHTVYH